MQHPSTVPLTTAPTTTTRPSTVPGRPAAVHRGFSTTRLEVLLTFDAGSDAGNTVEILDTLAANGVPAAFGVTGRWAERNPDLVRRIARDGYSIVNHSYSHPSFTGVSTHDVPLSHAERLAQLTRADAAISALTGHTTLPWFRPPYGDYDGSVLADVASAGYRHVLLWTVDSLGWNGLVADAIVRRVLDRAEPGAVYLFHVGSQSADLAALPRIISGLRARGYSFVGLSAAFPLSD